MPSGRGGGIASGGVTADPAGPDDPGGRAGPVGPDARTVDRRTRATGGTAPSGRRSIAVTDDLDDPRWDHFVAATPDAHHTQSAMWGHVKALEGWRPLRVVVERDGRVAGGAQLLCRHVRGLGGVAYLPRGPVAPPDDPAVADAAVTALARVVREARLHAVLVEPDPTTVAAFGRLPADHLLPTDQRRSLAATTVVDLTPDPDQLLAGMRSKTRYNLRLAERRGIEVRHGDRDDLATFHRLLVATAARQGFTAPTAARFGRWYDLLGERGHLQVFVAEYRGTPVSAMLGVAFGSTFVYKRGAWSGEHGDLRPNEALHWAAMRWARAAGYRRYDFDGIDRAIAEQVVAGAPLPDQARSTVTRFKLGFGGEVVLLPASRLFVAGGLQRRLYRLAGPRLADAQARRSRRRRRRDTD